MEYLHQDERISAALSDIFYHIVSRYDAHFPFTDEKGTYMVTDAAMIKGIASRYAEWFSVITKTEITEHMLFVDYIERHSETEDEECSS